MVRLALTIGLLLTTSALLALAPTANASLVGVGGDCDQTVHVECGGNCHLYVSGQCIIIGQVLVGVGGDCSATVHTGGCSHMTADGPCWLYAGGANGACIVYIGE